MRTKSAGISEKCLGHKKTRRFIFNFIKLNGGLEALKEEIEAPPSPAWDAAQEGGFEFPPPPPPAQLELELMECPAEGTPLPPPPPPLQMGPIVPPTAGLIPPPLPPRFPPGGGGAPIEDTPSNVVDPRSALMDSIRLGITLKPAEVAERRGIPDTRNALLDEIRHGAKLKPLEPVLKTTKPTARSDCLAEILKKELAIRGEAFCGSDSSSDDDEDDDDDWI